MWPCGMHVNGALSERISERVPELRGAEGRVAWQRGDETTCQVSGQRSGRKAEIMGRNGRREAQRDRTTRSGQLPELQCPVRTRAPARLSGRSVLESGAKTL